VIIDAEHGGKECEGALDASEECKEKECPVQCTLSDWTPWGACSTTCGKGSRSRSRTVTTEAKHGGKECEDALEASEDCKERECPIDCAMNTWGDWSACSAVCGDGTRSRSRTTDTLAQFGGKECDATEDEEDCTIVCPASELCGNVKDAGNFSPIDKATVQNKDTDQKVETSDGEFCFSLKPGDQVTLSAESEGYIAQNMQPFTIAPDTTKLGDIVMSKILDSTEWRIVMKWKEQPGDLDSTIKTGQGRGCAIDYNDAGKGFKKCEGDGVRAKLEMDNRDITRNAGPETIRLKDVKPSASGKMKYIVHNYSGSTGTGETFKESNAVVDVFHGDKKAATFTVDDGKIEEPYWYVFEIDIKTGEITPIPK